MKRRTGRVLGFILLGVAVNFLVATACSMYTGSSDSSKLEPRPAFLPVASVGGPAHGDSSLQVRVWRSPGKAEFAYFEPLPVDRRLWERHELQEALFTGWPAYSFVGMRQGDNLVRRNFSWTGRSWFVSWRTGLFATPVGWLDRTWIPLRPWWPGFAVNTAFYGVAAWGGFAAARGWRGWRRKVRGECAACRYPVGAASVCSECGRGVRPEVASQPDVAGASEPGV